MSKAEKNALLMLGGLAALFWALTSRTVAIPGIAKTSNDLYALADEVVASFFNRNNVDPMMLTAMAMIESSGNPLAVRYEPAIGDASIGLMQTLVGTAKWLATDMGYNDLGVPSMDDLLDPRTSMYFGAAYVSWLRNYGGVRRSDEWVVKSYNGGPGADNSQVENHWRKYQAALAAL